jgi:hypothetical protein
MFEWFGVLDAFVRADVLELLRKRGIELETTLVSLSGPAGPIDNYALVQAEPLTVFHPKHLQHYGITVCAECGNAGFKNPLDAKHRRPWYLLDASQRAAVPPVFTPALLPGSLLLSDTLAAILRELSVSGALVQEIGEWV